MMTYEQLLNLDMDAARAFCPRMPDGTPMSDEGLLAGMHKVRANSASFPAYARAESTRWLIERGYSAAIAPRRSER